MVVWGVVSRRAVLGFILLTLAGCGLTGGPKVVPRGEGIYHQVRRGENL